MATGPTSSPSSITIDASVAIAFCAREPGNHVKAKAYLDYHSKNGSQFFAPGVLIAEALYVFCKQLADGRLTATEHAQAVQSLEVFMAAVLPPPKGDKSLIVRAEELRAGYACPRSADGIYLALAEELTKTGPAEIVTFDDDMEKQAKKNAPTVKVTVLR
jgi:predicted nucleic acid-binding protein